MNCLACGAPLPDSPVFPGGTIECACGGVAVVPPAAPSAPEPVRSVAPHSQPLCPRCVAPLVLREDDGLVVTACPAHHGTFVAHRVLAELEHGAPDTARRLDGAADAVTRLEQTVDILSCPVCRAPMTARTLRGDEHLVVDVCAEHGTWFDAGELRAAVARHVAAGTATPRVEADLDRAGLAIDLVHDQQATAATDRQAIELGRDLVDTFNSVLLGRHRIGTRYD